MVDIIQIRVLMQFQEHVYGFSRGVVYSCYLLRWREV